MSLFSKKLVKFAQKFGVIRKTKELLADEVPVAAVLISHLDKETLLLWRPGVALFTSIDSLLSTS